MISAILKKRQSTLSSWYQVDYHMNKNNTYVATLTALLVIALLMNINPPILSLARHSSSGSSEKTNNKDKSRAGGRTGDTLGSSGWGIGETAVLVAVLFWFQESATDV
jgi:cobalamin synthase